MNRRANIGISITLAVHLALGPSQAVFADPQQEATDIIDASHDRARAIGDAVFYNFLLQVIAQVDPWQKVMQQILSSEDGWKQSSEKILQSIDNLSTPYQRAEDLVRRDQATSDALIHATNEYIRNYEQAVIGSRLLIHEMNSKELFMMHAKRTLEALISDVGEVCDNGVAVSVETPVMPSVSFHSPRIQFTFHVKSDYGDEKSSSQASFESPNQDAYGLQLFPITEKIFGNAAPAWNAGLSYGIPLSIYFLMGGKLAALSGAAATGAAATGTAATTSSSAAWGAAGYAAIIVVVLLAIDEAWTRQEASRAHNAVDRVFWDRASADDVQARIIQDCRSSRAKLIGVPELVKALSAAPQDLKAFLNFGAREKAAGETLDRLFKLWDAVSRRREALEAEKLSPLEIGKRLEASDEMKAYSRLFRELGIEGVFELLAVSLTNIGLAAEGLQLKLQDFRNDDQLGADAIAKQVSARVKLMKQRREQLYAWSCELSLRESYQDLPELLKSEQNGLDTATRIFNAWQMAYAKAFLSYFAGTAIDTQALEACLAQARDADAKYGKISLLIVVQARTISFLKLLQESQ